MMKYITKHYKVNICHPTTEKREGEWYPLTKKYKRKSIKLKFLNIINNVKE